MNELRVDRQEGWEFLSDIECSVCGEREIVVVMYMMYGGRTAWCKADWSALWQEKGEGRESDGVSTVRVQQGG